VADQIDLIAFLNKKPFHVEFPIEDKMFLAVLRDKNLTIKQGNNRLAILKRHLENIVMRILKDSFKQ
jgi:hypothetical protein